MRNTIFFLFFFLLSVFIFGQPPEYYRFQPSFQYNKDYFLNIEIQSKMISREGKIYHPYISKYKIKLNKIQNLKENFLFSFQVISSLHQHTDNNKKEKPQLNPLENVIFYFKIDSLGNYQGINNLENIKHQIRKNLPKDSIKKYAKLAYDRISSEIYYDNLYKDPTYTIAFFEDFIIAYFKYYNVSFYNGSENYSFKRPNFPFKKYNLPFTVTTHLKEEENGFRIGLHNKVDLKKMNAEDWESIYYGPDAKLNNFQKVFDLKTQESIFFNKSNALISQYTENVEQKTESHQNAVLYWKETMTLEN